MNANGSSANVCRFAALTVLTYSISLSNHGQPAATSETPATTRHADPLVAPFREAKIRLGRVLDDGVFVHGGTVQKPESRPSLVGDRSRNRCDMMEQCGFGLALTSSPVLEFWHTGTDGVASSSSGYRAHRPCPSAPSPSFLLDGPLFRLASFGFTHPVRDRRLKDIQRSAARLPNVQALPSTGRASTNVLRQDVQPLFVSGPLPVA